MVEIIERIEVGCASNLVGVFICLTAATNYPKKVLRGDISPDFLLRRGLKDIGLELALAQSASAPTPLGAASQQMFALAGPWGRAPRLYCHAASVQRPVTPDIPKNDTNETL